MNYENIKTPSMHRLDSATLSQLAFPGESNPIFPWEKSQWDNTVIQKKKKKKTNKQTNGVGGDKRRCVVVLSLFMQQKYVFASKSSSPGHSHVGVLFTNEEQKRWAHDVMITHFCHPWLECQTQNGIVRDHVFATFKCRVLTIP